ncbi:E3 ubiquitin-protein ligase TRIM65-like [Macrobrachium nipponense]|uniref:E3 ubiquitin-protein ligase TRIM65-like n=1 Tax=Macrobrachium nipponense TaxID=159736 RepID=UPI0030C81396
MSSETVLPCCCVCDVNYSDDRIPRSLKCGHSLCSPCVDALIPISKTCPECRTNFSERNSSELPVNHSVLRLSRLLTGRMGDAQVLPTLKFPLTVPLAVPQQNEGECPRHGCPLFFVCFSCAVLVCRECLSVDHPDPPTGCCFLLAIDEAVCRVRESHNAILKKYLRVAVEVKRELEIVKQLLDLTLKYCETTSRALQPSGGENSENLQEFSDQRETILTRLARITELLKSLRGIKDTIRKAPSPQDVLMLMKESGFHQNAFELFMEEDRQRKCQDITKIISSVKKDLKRLLTSEKAVYAVAEEGGLSRWAPLAPRNGRIHLYSLRDSSPPDDGVEIPYDLMRELLPKASPSVFLKTELGGSKTKGYVYVRMFGDTPRSRQTILLCSGEKGPSYRNTRFYGKVTGYADSEILQGGDYENDDGTGGRGVVEGIVSGDPYRRDVEAGLFTGFPEREPWRLGGFGIYLDGVRGVKDACAHGVVEEGLDVVKKAADVLSSARDVTVVDCGLVIPL